MRAPSLAFLCVLVAAGCVAADEAPEPRSAPSGRPVSDCFCTVSHPPPQPLEVGTAWTYSAQMFYNPDPEFTVVLAESTPAGYLFAAGAEDDLVNHALWGNEWFGHRGPDRATDWIRMFPGTWADGASWELWEGLRVTAHAADVMTPDGLSPGYVVEGGNERDHIRYEYAPSVGHVVRYLLTVDGEPFDTLTLLRVSHGASWIWYELGPLAIAPAPHEPAVLEVTAGWDAVLVSAGGTQGGAATVLPPGGATPWREEFSGEQTWRHAILSATEGRWAVTVQGKPDVEGAPPIDVPLGWGYAHVAPVKWLRSDETGKERDAPVASF